MRGNSTRIIKDLKNKLIAPHQDEGFEKIFKIQSMSDCNLLLRDWGITSMPITTIPEEEIPLIKFPRTKHLMNIGAATRDDLIMTQAEVKYFLSKNIVIEEKIDGANLGISIRDHKLVCQNRSHFVNSSYHPQFKYLEKWLNEHSIDLWKVLENEKNPAENNRYILYGEWVYAKHSIHYKSLPDWFIAFDLFDRIENKFWSR